MPEEDESSTGGTTDEEVFDSPTGWVASHVRGYLESDGSGATAGTASTRSCSRPAADARASAGARR